MAGDVDLLASYWTLAVGADPHTDHEHSTVGFRERVASAARAGFKGIGIWHADLEYTLRTHSLKEMRQILDDNGIRHVELEFILDWFVDGEEKRQSDIRKRLLFTAAEALKARSVKVGDFFKKPCPMPRLIDSFGTLCREAAEHGTRIGYEMMPFCAIDTLALARQLVEGAGAKNGGIFFDLWHMVKGDISYADLKRFPPQYVTGVELNDGFSKAHSMPDLTVETTQHRQLCGEGEFDIKGFIEAMRATGFAGPWGIEVLNKALRSRPIDEVTTRAFNTTIAQFRR
ncbi:MAG TPA: sugar phosphate isomerase/epimerase family protein [Steroidobacteraceae bacterium]|nr:sugar phosphate isomerase/epimerase family protein [Steroidobacteraceae bacterium]HUK02209.1 sugar phosphate isomerase/epimerase family protein [Steroidobacteraceae bacterium]